MGNRDRQRYLADGSDEECAFVMPYRMLRRKGTGHLEFITGAFNALPILPRRTDTGTCCPSICLVVYQQKRREIDVHCFNSMVEDDSDRHDNTTAAPCSPHPNRVHVPQITSPSESKRSVDSPHANSSANADKKNLINLPPTRSIKYRDQTPKVISALAMMRLMRRCPKVGVKNGILDSKSLCRMNIVEAHPISMSLRR